MTYTVTIKSSGVPVSFTFNDHAKAVRFINKINKRGGAEIELVCKV
jgi:hypothetical protein